MVEQLVLHEMWSQDKVAPRSSYFNIKMEKNPKKTNVKCELCVQ
jgi:hypothetical protein